MERYGHHPPLYPHRRGQPITPGFVDDIVCIQLGSSDDDTFFCIDPFPAIGNLPTVGCRLALSSRPTFRGFTLEIVAACTTSALANLSLR